VCLCVCLSTRTYPGPHARSLPKIFVRFALFGGLVLLWQGDEIPRGGAILVFFPIDDALYSRDFGAHTKTAEPIEMPFGVMSGLGPRNGVFCGDDGP